MPTTDPNLTNIYATVADLETRLKLAAGTDSTLLAALLQAASRNVDAYCGRVFYSEGTDEEPATRYYDSPKDSRRLSIDCDVLSLSEIALDIERDGTFSEVLATTDYVLHPHNSVPKWEVELLPWVGKSFPHCQPRSIRIKGVLGYAETVPAPVSEWVLYEAACAYGDRASGGYGLNQERQGEYYYSKLSPEQYEATRARVLAPFRRVFV